MPRAKEIFNDPRWFPHSLDLNSASIGFVKTSRDALSTASFLDQRFDVRGAEKTSVAISDLLVLLNEAPAHAPRYVFHTAFCCSTLLARCLDLEGACLALKEPEILMTLANYRRTNHSRLANPQDRDAIYKLINSLLFRRFLPEEAVLVKPTNPVNNLIGGLMRQQQDSRALLLHSDLKSFMVSLLKKGEEGRAFGRKLFSIFSLDSKEAQQLGHNQWMRMTDMQVMAVAWHLQWEHFLDAAQSLGSEQLRSLHCDQFLADSEVSLQRIIQHLQFPSLQENFADMVRQAPLTHDAKYPGKEFTSQDRSATHAETELLHAEGLKMILPWAQSLRFKHPYTEQVGTVL